jgi:hypothetical protein
MMINRVKSHKGWDCIKFNNNNHYRNHIIHNKREDQKIDKIIIIEIIYQVLEYHLKIIIIHYNNNWYNKNIINIKDIVIIQKEIIIIKILINNKLLNNN